MTKSCTSIFTFLPIPSTHVHVYVPSQSLVQMATTGAYAWGYSFEGRDDEWQIVEMATMHGEAGDAWLKRE